jgi:hypothetical protein
MIFRNKNLFIFITALFFTSSVHSFEYFISFFDRQRVALEKKAISFAVSRYLYFTPSMTTTIMALEGLHGYVVGLSSSHDTSLQVHAHKLFNVVAYCKIAEHIIFNDTGLRGFQAGHYQHVMTLLSIAFGYSLGCSTRALFNHQDEPLDKQLFQTRILSKNSL